MSRRDVAVLFVCLGLTACSSGSTPDKESAPAPTVAPAPPPRVERGPVQFGAGFFPEEGPKSGPSWRWMGEEGTITLKNTRRDMLLTIKGLVYSPLPSGDTITVKLNGQALEPLASRHSETAKQYTIPAAKQGDGEWCELRLSAAKSYVPKEVDRTILDDRRLGFAVTSVMWEPK